MLLEQEKAKLTNTSALLSDRESTQTPLFLGSRQRQKRCGWHCGNIIFFIILHIKTSYSTEPEQGMPNTATPSGRFLQYCLDRCCPCGTCASHHTFPCYITSLGILDSSGQIKACTLTRTLMVSVRELLFGLWAVSCWFYTFKIGRSKRACYDHIVNSKVNLTSELRWKTSKSFCLTLNLHQINT